MTILFKNGRTIDVSQAVVNILQDRIISGCKTFQFFSEDVDDGNAALCINVTEIVAIYQKKPNT